MFVLVTGAAGFIAGHVIRALLDRGDQVHGVDRLPAHGPDTTAYTHLQADLTTSRVWHHAARRADAVIHLAARPGVRSDGHHNQQGGGDVERERARDILGTAESVLAATPLRTPVVVTSSAAVYGEGHRARGSREDDPLRPRGGYGRWKLAVEARCAERSAAGGLVSVARPFSVAGPGQRPDMAISRWLAAVTTGGPVTVLGDLARSRDVTAVEDVTAGLVALLDAAVVDGRGGTVNLGAGRPRTHREVLDAMERVCERPARIERRPPHPDDVRHTWADPTRAADLIGWQPHHDLDDLLRRQLQASTALVAA